MKWILMSFFLSGCLPTPWHGEIIKTEKEGIVCYRRVGIPGDACFKDGKQIEWKK